VISDNDLEAVRAEMRAGRKIEAIKLLRETTGLGLAEAKQFVERLEHDPQAVPAELGRLSDSDVQQIQAAVFAGDKIGAIKLHRTASGFGLKESKDFIEALEAELRRTEPTKFTAAPAKGCVGAVLCILVFLGALIGWLA
jgi:ribosomal protein L7/L12